MKFVGLVDLETFATGSKSERQAVVLRTSQGSHLLRQKDGNPFFDEELLALVGKRLEVEGTVHGQTLIISNFEMLVDSDENNT